MKRILKVGFIIGLILILTGIICSIIIVNVICKDVSLEQLDKNKLTYKINNINICDANGNNINKKNNYISLKDLPNYTTAAFLSIEDKAFYEHNGLNYKRMLKALYNNIKSGSFKEGASTISQQLVKNTQLSNDKTIERKLKEIYITQELEKEYTKDQILEMYLNIIYFGNSSYGLESASQNYFGKSAKDLTLSESAVLAGVIKSPALYSPIYEPDRCKERRNLVLSEMHKDGYITEMEFKSAINENIILTDTAVVQQNEDYLYDYIDKAISEAKDILDMTEEEIASNELIIHTYMDQNLQKQAFETIKNYRIKNANDLECDGLVNIIDNSNNAIIAYASNSKYKMSNMLRQPGSAIKPIMVYAPALEEQLITPLTKILDEKIDIDGYSPNNLGKLFHGYINIRDAVAQSLNIPAVKLLQTLGIEKSKNYANKMGIEFTSEDNGYALALGGFTEGILLEDLTNAYTTFANLGLFKPATTIKCIKNKYGMSIYEDTRQNEQVISDSTAYLMTSILQDGVKYGTSKRLNTLNYEIAGKTGTIAVSNSNQNTDAVSIAYTQNYTIGAWLGNYSLDPKYNLESSNNGGTYATSIVKDCFNIIYKDNPPNNFIIPNSVTKCKINKIKYDNDNIISLASNNIDDRYIIEDYFCKNNLPKAINSTPIEIDWVLKKDNKSVIIEINANKSQNYQIIKVNKNKEIVLETISDKDGTIKIVDNNIDYETEYHYYIKYKSKEEKKYQISNKVKVVIPKPKSFKLHNDNWLFA